MTQPIRSPRETAILDGTFGSTTVMGPQQQKLERFQQQRKLVSVRRDGVDDRSMQGFILNVSDHLLLLHYVYDFAPDGLLLLRRRDVTSVENRATNRFQRDLLEVEGVLEKVDFSHRPPIRTYADYLRSLPPDEIVIVEDELADEPEFMIGRVTSVERDVARVLYFNGTATWDEEPSEIPLARITSCQIRTNYTQFYARHFARLRSSGRDPGHDLESD